MERKDFLRAAGAIGLGSMLPIDKTKAAMSKINKSLLPVNTCILIPQETAGPYPWTMGATPFFRQDITEGNPGTPLNLSFTVVNINNGCAPVPNARVDIWHCNRDGYYSEYDNQPGYLGTQNHVGETFFRGYQVTDINGVVNFVTIYPGWYTGRATHIHFQVLLNSVLQATSQMAFADALNTTVNGSAGYSAHGQNSLTNSGDNVFSDTANTQYELPAIAANSSGGYDATLTIGIVAPLSGVIDLEPETGGQFKVEQNFPNPYMNETTIPFNLKHLSDVKIELWDLSGRKVGAIAKKAMNAGDQAINVNMKKLGIVTGNYIYQIEVTNNNGTFKQCKMMSAIQ